MKKTIYLLVLLAASALLSSHTPPAQQSNWSNWATSNCYSGIDFCTKRSSKPNYEGKYEWSVKFRNRYYEVCGFSYELRPSYVGSVSTYTNRLHLKNGEEFTTWTYLDEANYLNIFISQVRVGNQSGPYMNCDR
ncbi:MAG: hypothetical protein JNK66_08090 [Chitinophagales bacterium]|nr:hypothetical protein [Chitinophagales bacterium]